MPYELNTQLTSQPALKQQLQFLLAIPLDHIAGNIELIRFFLENLDPIFSGIEEHKNDTRNASNYTFSPTDIQLDGTPFPIEQIMPIFAEGIDIKPLIFLVLRWINNAIAPQDTRLANGLVRSLSTMISTPGIRHAAIISDLISLLTNIHSTDFKAPNWRQEVENFIANFNRASHTATLPLLPLTDANTPRDSRASEDTADEIQPAEPRRSQAAAAIDEPDDFVMVERADGEEREEESRLPSKTQMRRGANHDVSFSKINLGQKLDEVLVAFLQGQRETKKLYKALAEIETKWHSQGGQWLWLEKPSQSSVLSTSQKRRMPSTLANTITADDLENALREYQYVLRQGDIGYLCDASYLLVFDDPSKLVFGILNYLEAKLPPSTDKKNPTPNLLGYAAYKIEKVAERPNRTLNVSTVQNSASLIWNSSHPNERLRSIQQALRLYEQNANEQNKENIFDTLKNIEYHWRTWSMRALGETELVVEKRGLSRALVEALDNSIYGSNHPLTHAHANLPFWTIKDPQRLKEGIFQYFNFINDDYETYKQRNQVRPLRRFIDVRPAPKTRWERLKDWVSEHPFTAVLAIILLAGGVTVLGLTSLGIVPAVATLTIGGSGISLSMIGASGALAVGGTCAALSGPPIMGRLTGWLKTNPWLGTIGLTLFVVAIIAASVFTFGAAAFPGFAALLVVGGVNIIPPVMVGVAGAMAIAGTTIAMTDNVPEVAPVIPDPVLLGDPRTEATTHERAYPHVTASGDDIRNSVTATAQIARALGTQPDAAADIPAIPVVMREHNPNSSTYNGEGGVRASTLSIASIATTATRWSAYTDAESHTSASRPASPSIDMVTSLPAMDEMIAPGTNPDIDLDQTIVDETAATSPAP